jgi:hypothetical protein
MIPPRFSSIQPPTPQLSIQFKKLKIFMIVFGAFSALKLFFMPMIAIQDLLSILMLWCAMQQLNVCMFVMFQLFTIYPLIMLGVSMGTLIQHAENPFQWDSTYKLLQFLVCVVNIPVYIYGNIVVFHTYREVKACLRGLGDITGSGTQPFNVNSGNEMVGGGGGTVVQDGKGLAKPDGGERFQGKGVTLG